MTEVRMRFVGAELWQDNDDPDVFPYPVPIQRVPIVGELIGMPDNLGRWEVALVEYDYAEGLAHVPIVGVTLTRPNERGHLRNSEGLLS